MRKFKLIIMLAFFMNLVVAKISAIEVKNADGVTIYYYFTGSKTSLVVSNSPSTKPYSGKVVIPESVTYEGTTYPVTGISKQAFYGCSDLTVVSIPNTVTYISEEAFYNCHNIGSLTIGSGVTTIGDNAFYGCRPYKIIWLPDKKPKVPIFGAPNGWVNYVPNSNYGSVDNKKVYPLLNYVFDYNGIRYVPISWTDKTCDAIDCVYDETSENVNLGSPAIFNGVEMKVGNIGLYIFAGNKYLKSATINENISSLPKGSFYNCLGLTSVTIPNSVTSIGDASFWGCSGLTSIDIPSSVTTIDEAAFYECSGLTSFTIPESVSTISKNTFYNCSGMTSMTIPNTITSIGFSAFENCSGLISINIPNSVEIIREDAFKGCSGLISVTFNCKKIGNWFDRNASIKEVIIGNEVTNIGYHAFGSCSGLTVVNIPDNVTTIDKEAFSGCTGLTSVTIGSGVTSIGQNAFGRCLSINKLLSKAINPPVCGSSALYDIDKVKCILCVPLGCTSAYQQADQWKEFFFIQEDDFAAEKGDVNGDGNVNAADIVILVNYIMGKTPDISNNIADVNGDNKFDISDIIMLVNQILSK